MSRSTVVFLAVITSFSIMVIGISDAFTFRSQVWSEAGRSRRAWVIMMIGFGPLAVLLYWGTVRFDLQDPHRFEG